MTDPRRVGNAQRRRMGAPSSMYAVTTKAPTFGQGDAVKAQGRYGTQTVVAIHPNAAPATGGHDGHAYSVRGGKGGRVTTHLSGELQPFTVGTEELQ